jgi:hypothetical protein
VRPSRRSIGTVSLVAVLLASVALAETGTTKERAHLRKGPSGATEQLGDIDAGTRLDLLGESAGWRQVRAPDGRVGWVWAEHVALAGTEAKPAPPAGGTRSLSDEIHDLRDDVAVLKQRPEPATAADLERVRQELDRIATAERDLARRLDERAVPPSPVDPPPDGGSGSPLTYLAVGAVFGFIASRLLQGRRDRWQRNRLRV